MAQKIASRSALGIGILAALAMTATVPDLSAESIASKVGEGNRLFSQGKYADAEKAYLDAQVKNPGRPEIIYNLGNALIKQKQYGKGIQSLSQSATKGNKVIRENSWYNTGNALFEAGRLKDSAAAFIQALKLDPSDQDAKHNLELALSKLKEQQQSAGSQKQSNSDNSKQDKQDKSSDGKTDRQSKQSPNRQNKIGDQGNQENPARQPESQNAQRPGSISKEQADQILDAVRAQEIEQQRKLLETLARRKANGRDW